MEEEIRSRENRAAPTGLGNPFASEPEDNLATVASGPYSERLPVANATVREIRARLRDRFDIDPRSQAFVNGREVPDDERVRAGELLTFAHRAGEKGGLLRVLVPAEEQAEVRIKGQIAHTRTPEGHEKSMPLAGLLERIAPRLPGTGNMVLPDGAKALLSRGKLLVCVHQIPPRTYNFKWICAQSNRPFGKGTDYRTVRISLPYLILMELFGPAPCGRMTFLSAECFFRREPLKTLQDELLFPALLNCSKFDPPDGRPLAWICTQHLDRSFDLEAQEGERLWKAHRALLHCLLETGFNRSSEHHEGNSWFNASNQIDSRLSTVEAWEQATHQDPLFVLEVPWLPTGLTVRGMADRIFQIHAGKQTVPVDAADLVRTILNQQ